MTIVSPSTPPRSRWQQRLQQWAGAGQVPEDSIGLRLLVQALVTVGIIALVIAAWEVVPAPWINLLAIPPSGLGAYWSHRTRHRTNTLAKFAIAFGMLVALGIFLSRLLERGGDTRMLLAELLIHLLVCHSFDMPRRKDLGYSMVIALILMGVAATISQTFAFAPALVLFLAIALPMLVLDYRARLGLRGWHQPAVGWQEDLGRLGRLLLVVTVLGLGIFALLPRFPGYQVRNFPISAPIEFQGEFRGNQISRPATGGDALAEEATGVGQSQGVGAGQLDPVFYYGFGRRINQNLRGQMTPQVVLRVRSQAPGFWRVMAFDQYTGQGWAVSDGDTVEVLNRSGRFFQTILPPAAQETEFTETALADLREVIQTYTAVRPLQNVVPMLYQGRQLYFPTEEIAMDTQGGLRSPVALLPGLTYTVISRVPYRDRTQLRRVVLHRGPTGQGNFVQTPGFSLEPDRQQPFLQVPDALQERLQETATTLLSRSPTPITAPYEMALFLAQALKQNYTLQPELPFFEPEEDLVEAFLYRYGGGYPDHFATTLTLLLRSLGIPARLVVGFSPGEFNPFTGYYEVQNVDAHAMTEVFFPGYGWFAFDPIPGHPLLPPEVRDSQTFGVVRQFWQWVAGWLPSPVAGWLNSLWAAIAQGVAWGWGFLNQGWGQALGGVLAGLGLSFGGWLGWQGWRQWCRHRHWQTLPPLERLYQRLLLDLAEQGYPKPPTQTPLEHLQTYSPPQAAQREVVETLVNTYVQWRYGAIVPPATAIAALEHSLKTLRQRRSPLP